MTLRIFTSFYDAKKTRRIIGINTLLQRKVEVLKMNKEESKVVVNFEEAKEELKC